ncbi:hypothetical protein B0H13DRAFT_1888899 [Mycena leptocephala]|nr:hypothetical protein B0H13DRAFT_1888899 [Mycena leptocephala]
MQDETGYENETRGTAEVRKNEKKAKNGTYSLYGVNPDHLYRHDHSQRISVLSRLESDGKVEERKAWCKELHRHEELGRDQLDGGNEDGEETSACMVAERREGEGYEDDDPVEKDHYNASVLSCDVCMFTNNDRFPHEDACVIGCVEVTEEYIETKSGGATIEMGGKLTTWNVGMSRSEGGSDEEDEDLEEERNRADQDPRRFIVASRFRGFRTSSGEGGKDGV